MIRYILGLIPRTFLLQAAVLAIVLCVTTFLDGAPASGTFRSYLDNRILNRVNPLYGPLILMDWSPPIPLLVSEVMFNPTGNEPEAEWLEIYNYGLRELEIELFRVGDSETAGDYEGMYIFPSGASIQSGEAIIIANQSFEFEITYGFKPDFELNNTDIEIPELTRDMSWAHGSLSLKNSGDEVILLDPSGGFADMVSWGDSYFAIAPPVPVVPEGHSIERYPAHVDTDSTSDWRDQSSPSPGIVDLSPPPTRTPLPATSTIPPTDTPTSTPTGTQTATATSTVTSIPSATLTPTPTGIPSPADYLLVSEILYNPSNSDPQREWIEIYNPTMNAYDLADYKIGDEETSGGIEGMMVFPSGYMILPDQRLVIASSADHFYAYHGFLPDFEMVDSNPDVPDMLVYTPWAGGTVHLEDTGDEVLLLGPDDTLVDALSWGISNWAFDPPCPDVPSGHSLERYPGNIDTNTAYDWIAQPLPNPGSP